MREYIWLPEAEIAPTMGSRAQVDRSLAVVEAVNTVAPIVYYVHMDQLHRPMKMTNVAKAVIWDAVWQAFGGLHALTGTASNNLRFPGQWFQTETGLHYNWHRSYDPTLGRYTQPDPLGFVDGPSLYSYVNSTPLLMTDFSGLMPDDPKDPYKYDPKNPPKSPDGKPGVQEPDFKKPPRPLSREKGCELNLAKCLAWCKGNCPSAIRTGCNSYCIGRYIFCIAVRDGDVEP